MANVLSDTDETSSTQSSSGSYDWELVASSPRSATALESPFETFLSEDDPNSVIQPNYFSTLPVSMGDSSQSGHATEEAPTSEKTDVNGPLPTENSDLERTATEGIASASQTLASSTFLPLASDFIQSPSPRCRCNLRKADPEINVSQKLELQAILDELRVATDPMGPTCKLHAWWKGQLGFWRIETGQTNTLWSIALAAAVTGIFFLGRRWQRLRLQNEKLHLELCRKDKKICQLSYQLLRMKDSFSCSRRIPVLRAERVFESLYDRV